MTNRYYYHLNQLGSVVALTSSTGTILQKYIYDSFGKAYIYSGTTLIPLSTYTGTTYSNSRLYTGREYDRETNLYYLRARYYSSDTGKFISRDPVRQSDQVNLYTYVANSPLRYKDPTGEFLETAWDVGNVLYDAGRGVKNIAELAYGGAQYGYAAATGNACLKKQALAGIKQDGAELGEVAIDASADAIATMIPFVPAGSTKVIRAGKKIPIWSSTKARSSVENAFEHWKGHGSDFPELNNATQYVKKAKEFFSNPPSGTIKTIRDNGDSIFYEPTENIFGVSNSVGAPKTFFKPTNGVDYFLNQ